MRLATPRSTPRDDPNHHYLWVIVGMLYVSQGSAGELRDGAGGGRWRGGGSVGATVYEGERAGVAAGPGWVAMLWLPRAYIARTNPNGNSSLGGASPIMHTPVLTGRPCSRSLLVSPSTVLHVSLFHLASVSRSFSVLPHLLRNLHTLPSSSSRLLAPITQQFHRLLHSILGSTQLQRNRRAILGDKVTS